MVGRGSRMAKWLGAKIGTFEWPIACANTTIRAEPFVPDVPCLRASSHPGPRLGGCFGLMSRTAPSHVKAPITGHASAEPRPTIASARSPSS